MKFELELYAVRNKDGEWFRAKGYGGGGASWVDDIKKAKIYSKIGQARSRVTFFATNYPEFGVPEIVKLKVSESEAVDETLRVEKSISSKKKKEAVSKVIQNKRLLESAKKRLDDAKKDYDRITKTNGG